MFGVILKWSFPFPSYHPNFPIGKFYFSSWLPSMHDFLREFFIYPFTGFYIIIVFCSLLHSFFSLFTPLLRFPMVVTSSHPTLCCYPIFVSRFILSQSLFSLFVCSIYSTSSPFAVPVSCYHFAILPLLPWSDYACFYLLFSWSFDVPWPVSLHSMRWRCLDPRK